MRMNRTTLLARISRLFNLAIALVIASSAVFVGPASAFAGSTPPPIAKRAQIEAQLAQAGGALVFNGGNVALDRSKLGGVEPSLRAAIERVVADINSGAIGISIAANGKVASYGARGWLDQPTQQASGQPGAPVINRQGVYIWVNSFWTSMLKSGYWQYVYALAWYWTNFMCKYGVVCYGLNWFNTAMWGIITNYLRPYNVGSFTIFFPWRGYIQLTLYRWFGYWRLLGWFQTNYWVI